MRAPGLHALPVECQQLRQVDGVESGCTRGTAAKVQCATPNGPPRARRRLLQRLWRLHIPLTQRILRLVVRRTLLEHRSSGGMGLHQIRGEPLQAVQVVGGQRRVPVQGLVRSTRGLYEARQPVGFWKTGDLGSVLGQEGAHPV